MAYIGRSVDVGIFEKQVLTPDSTTTSFALTYAVGSANSLFVVYGGVVQEPGVAYSVSGGGQTIVFSEAPATGTTLYIIYYGKQLTTPRAAGQETTKQTFSGDGTTTVFTLTDPPVVPAGIMVFVDGILQREGSGNNFVSSGSTIAFTSAPDSGAEIDVYTLVKEKVSIDTVADGSITRTKLAQSAPYWDAQGNVGISNASPSTGSGGGLTLGTTSAGKSIHLYTSTYAGSGLVNFFGTDGAVKMQMGAASTNAAFIYGTGGSLLLGGSGSEAMRIDSAGKVGVGITNPANTTNWMSGPASTITLDSYGVGTRYRYYMYRDDTSDVFSIGNYQNTIKFYQTKRLDSTEAVMMSLDTAGVLTVGTPPGINRIYGSSGNPLYGLVDQAIMVSNDTNTVNHRVGIALSPAGRTGSGIFANNVSATAGNEDSNLEFYTTKEGNVNAALGMTLDQNGILSIGTTSTYGSSKLVVNGGMQVLVPNGGGQSNIQTYVLGIPNNSTKTFTWTPSDSVYQLTDIHVSAYVSAGAGFCHARWSIGGYLTSGTYSDIYEMRRINGGSVTCSVASLYGGTAVRFTITNTAATAGGIQVRIMEATQGTTPGTLVVT